VQLLEGERMRARNAEAKNMLESFIIETRSRVSSDESVESVSQEEERATISTDFEAAEDWLYEEGRDLDAAAYQKKKKELEKMTAPIFLRVSELEARPRVVAQANDAMNWTLTLLQTWVTDRPEVTEAERGQLSGMVANFTSWLEEMEAKQAEMPLYEAPAYLSQQVTSKLEPIEKEVRRLIRKPKPKPPKAPKNGTKANGTNATDANATDANSSTANTPDEAGNETEADEAEGELPSKEEL